MILDWVNSLKYNVSRYCELLQMILVDDKQVQEGTRDKRLKKTYNILRESHISLKWFSCESPILVELDLNMLVLVFLKVIPFTRNSKSCNENFARVDSFSHILISP